LNIFRNPLCLGLSLFLAALSIASTAQQNTKSTTDQKSKYYLLCVDDSFPDSKAYHSQVVQIQHLGAKKDIKGVAEFAERIEQTYGHQTDMRVYFALMDVVINTLESYDFGPGNIDKREELTQKYVLVLLAHRNVPLDMTSRLLVHLFTQEQTTLYKRPCPVTDWALIRSVRAPLWLQTRLRIKELIIPGYDMTSEIPIGWPTDYDRLKDPVYLADRAKDIRETNKKLRGRSTQAYVRSLDDTFSQTAESEVIFYYLQKPSATEELLRLLSTYVDDEATRQRILDQVSKSIVSAAQK
jgi:hypothetical protein